jgi:predicted secreted protein
MSWKAATWKTKKDMGYNVDMIATETSNGDGKWNKLVEGLGIRGVENSASINREFILSRLYL